MALIGVLTPIVAFIGALVVLVYYCLLISVHPSYKSWVKTRRGRRILKAQSKLDALKKLQTVD